MAKGYRKPIKWTTPERSVKRKKMLRVDLSGPKPVNSIGRKRYTMMVLDVATIFTKLYFLRHKFDAAETFPTSSG